MNASTRRRCAYVFVAQDEPRIEVYRRNDEGGWVLYEARPGERLELRSIGVSLDVSAVYENPLEANQEGSTALSGLRDIKRLIAAAELVG
ncbi:MAG TPA: hypothetical protein VKP30_09430 [Polyangiaceae bacterium]|nr:hypothetical protein [Polyangiaceae bacterium]